MVRTLMKRRQLQRAARRCECSASSSRRWRRLLFEPLEDRHLLAAVPSITLNMPPQAFIGSTVNFTATLDIDTTALPAPATPSGYGHTLQANLVASSDSWALPQRSEVALRRELVIIDPATPDWQPLVDSLKNTVDPTRKVDAWILHPNVDGMAALTQILAQYRDLDAVHIVSHGTSGKLRLGRVALSTDNLADYASQIRRWQGALKPDADLLVYGCDVAADASGKQLATSLSALTGADVAASTDETGAAARGGNWNLEYAVGPIETHVAFSADVQTHWNNTLSCAAEPAVTLTGLPTQAFIGSNVSFSATFQNTGSATGYGPIVELVFPRTGVDGVEPPPSTTPPLDPFDGLDFVGATFLGTPLTPVILTFPGTFPGTGTVDDPFAVDTSGNPLTVTGNSGDRLVAFQLPFGSYTVGQPQSLVVTASKLSNGANVNVPLTVYARGQFQYGCTPLNDPATDPTVLSSGGTSNTSTNWSPNGAVTPTLMTLTKTYLGPEDETATGPNFPRQYEISLSAAADQTLTTVAITDVLPTNIVVTGVTIVNPAGTVNPSLVFPLGPLAVPANNVTLATFPTVTGTGGADAVVRVSFYVPRLDSSSGPVVPPTTGAPGQSVNETNTTAAWQPLDPRDWTIPPATVTAGPAYHNFLHDRSLAIQKSVALVTDVTPTGYGPDDTVEYTLNFQVSDFFAFQNVVLDDVLSDGQRFDTTFTPTLTVTEHGLTTPVSGVQLANYTVNTPSGSPTTQALQFRVSNELTARQISPPSYLFDTNLTGGCVPSAGTGGPPPDCTVYNAGQTTGQVKFRAVIQRNYGPDTPPTGVAVVQADHMSNGVTASGNVLNDATLTPTGSTVTDTSAASFEIVTGTITKNVYAINGNTTVPSPPVISPGDQVTFEITVTAPITRFDDAYVFDFLPLPVFYATEVHGPFDPTVNATVPPAGTAKFGPGDTFYALSSVVPIISTDSTSNSVQFAYGSYAASPPVMKTADILFTVTATDQPFADGLFITNLARVSTKNTPGQSATEDKILQIKLATPAVNIYKGVVGYNSTGLTLGGITFSSPAVTPPSFIGGPLNTQAQAIAIGASNATGLDAADPVRFAIVAQNTGGSDAYNVVMGETIPAGYVAPASAATFASTTHLTVYRGGGGSALSGQLVNTTVRAATTADLASATFNGTDTFTNAPTTLDSVPLAMGDRVLVKNQTTGTQNGIYVVTDAVHGTWVRASDFAVGTSIATPYAITILGGNTNKNSFYALASSIVVNTSSSTWNLGAPVADYFYIYDPTAKTFSVVLADNRPPESDGRTGSLNQAYDASGAPFTDGSNAVVVLYDLPLDGPPSVDAVQPLQLVTNTASLTNYAGSDNGPNFLTSPLTDPATVTVAPPQVAKTLVSTSIVNANNSNTQAVIGETAQYSATITIPEGVTNLAQFVDTLDAGLAFVSLDTIAVNDSIHLSTSIVGGFAQVLLNARTALAAPGLVATFNFGTLTNTDTNNAVAETVTITYTAVVLNVSGNQSGTLLNDTAAFDWTNPDGSQHVQTRAAQDVAVIEPLLATTKAVEVANIPGNKIGQQSDPVKYTITIAQDPASQTDAFDTSFSDPLPKDVLNRSLLLAPSFTVSDTAGSVTAANFQLTGADAGGWTLSTTPTGTFDMLKSTPTRTITITVTGTLPTYVTPGQQFTNTDAVQWTSLSGSPGPISPYNPASTERTGAGGVDDYLATASETVTVAYPTVAKNLINTSIDNGLGSSNDRTQAVIGELAYYQVIVTVPQGTTPLSNLVDTLPAGLAFVRMDPTQPFVNSDPAHVTFTGSTTPTITSNGQSIDFPLGTITNTDTNNAIPETLTFRYEVVVLNVTGNLNGVTLRNSARAWWNNMVNSSPIGQAEAVTIIEPQLRTTKAVTVGGGVGNPGDPVTYTLTIQQAPGNPTDAFDVTISDPLPTGTGASLILTPSFNVTTSGLAPSVNNSNFQLTGSNGTGWTLSSVGSFNFFKIQTGIVTITITGTLADVAPVGTLVPGQTVANTNNLQWTSLTGSPGQISPYNTNSYERTGNPSSPPAAENNFYFSNAAATFVAKASDLQITKTDVPDPVLASGTLTYTLTVTNNGPAAAPNTVVTDTLPTNVTFSSASLGCTHLMGVVTCSAGTLNPAVSVVYTVVVTVNSGTPVGTVLSNVARVTSDNLDPILSNNTATANTTVTEIADLQITKTNAVTTVIPGKSLSYTILVTNAGPSPVAGATVADTFPNMSGVSWTAETTGGASGFTTPGTGNINDTVTMPNGSTITYTVTGTVLPSVTGSLINTATVTPPPAVTDPNLANNTATHTDTLTPEADLAVTKTDAPHPVVAGNQITYTVTVTNLGPSDAATVALTDPVPANTTFVSATVPSGWTLTGGVIYGGTGTLTFSKNTSLAALASASFTIVVKVNSDVPAATTVTNLATATTATTDPVPTNNTATATTTVDAQADVAITKSGPATIIPGQNMTYTLTATNNGPSTALTVSLTDPLPLNTTFFTVTVPGGWASTTPAVGGTGTVTFSKASMAAAETASFTIVVNVTAATANGTALINSATVTATTIDPTPGNNTASTTTTTTTQADLAVTKSGPATVLPGGNLSYTITVTNNGSNAALSAVVTDPVPTNTTFQSVGALPSGWTASTPSVGGTGTVQFTKGSMAAAETASFTIVVQASSIAEDGIKLTNMATVASSTTDPVPNNNTATATTTVVHQADVAVTKTGAGTVVAGRDLTYTLHATNIGPNTAQNAVVTDPLPPNTTLVSAPAPTGWTRADSVGPGGTGTLRFTKNTAMLITDTADFTIVVHTNEELPIGSVLSNTATVTTTTLDPAMTNNTATANTTVDTLADLVVTKTGAGTILAGNNLTYTVTVTNNGPSHAIDVAVSDPLPLNTTLVSVTLPSPLNGWSYTGTSTLLFSKSTLMDYPETASFTVVVHVNADTPNSTTLNNTATVTSTTTDPTPSNNTATATTTVNTQVDLAITKTGPATVIPGNNLSYTLVVTNNGPSDAQTVTVSDPIPTNTTFVSATPPTGWTRTDVVPPGGTGTLGFARSTAMPPSTTETFTIVVLVDGATANGIALNNVATVATATTEPVTSNNTATATTTVTTQADLAVTKSGPATVHPSGNLTYTIIVTNHGPNAAIDAVLTDLIPTNTTFQSVIVPANWTRTDSIPIGGTGNLQFSKTAPTTAMANGETATFTIVVQAGATVANGTTLTNRATASSSTTDPNLTNNTGTATTSVVSQADLVVTKTDTPDPVLAGRNLTYTLLVTNNGPDAAQSVVVTDPTPTNTNFQSVTVPAGWTQTGVVDVGNSGTLSFTKSSMANLETATFTIVLQVNANTANGINVVNRATATSSSTDPNPSNNTSTATTTVNTQADLAISKTGPGTVIAGNNISYTILVTNNGPSDAQGVIVADPTPANTTFVSASAVTGWTLTNPAVGGTGIIQYTKTAAMSAATNATFTIVVRANASTPDSTTLTNLTTATTTTTDPDPTNNTATATTTASTVVDLAITKTGPVPATVIPGNNLSYTIVVTNNGPSDAQAVTVADPIPTNTTFVSATLPTGWTRTDSPLIVGGGTGTLGFAKTTAMPPSTTATFIIVVNVNGGTANGTVLSNVATVATATTEPVKNNNTATATTTATTQADLAVTKTGPAAVIPGDNLSYTITVTNLGPNDGLNATLTDPLPANTTLVSVTLPSPLNGWIRTDAVPIGGNGPLQFSKTTAMTNGETESFTIVVQADSGLANNVAIPNRATVSSSTTDPTLSNNTASVTTTTTTQADLVVTKTGSATVLAGNDVSYTLTVSNVGPNAAQTVTVTDPTPVNTTFQSVVVPGGWARTDSVPVNGTGTLTFTKSSMANPETASFTIVVRANANAGNGSTLTNLATAASATTDPTPSNNTATATTTVSTQADVAVTKTGPVTAQLAGNNFSYTVTVSNNGPSDAQTVIWTDTVPTGTSFVSQNQTAGPTFTLNNTGNAINNTVATLAAGASATFNVVVHLNSNVSHGTVLNNTATVSTTTTETIFTNNTSTATTTVNAQADLVASKTGPATVLPGNNLSYTLTVTNSGPSDAQSVTVTDPVPANTVFFSLILPSGWARTDSVAPGSMGTLSFTKSSMASGEVAVFTIVVNVSSGAGSGVILTNLATASSTTTDPVPDNNTATATTTVDPRADLVMTKSAAGTVLAGSDLTYTLTVINSGPNTAQAVSVTDPTPTNSTFVSASFPVGWTRLDSVSPGSTGMLWFSKTSMISAETASFTIVVHVNPGTISGTSLINLATASSTTTDPAPDNNTATTTTTVDTRADLAVSKSGPATAAPGGNLTYTVTVTNNGPSTALSTGLTDAVPTNTTFVSATPPAGWTRTDAVPVGGTGTLSFTKPSMANAETGSFTIVVHINSSVPDGTTLTNVATATTATTDPDLTNNTATATTTTAAQADLVVSKTGAATVLAGNNLTYTITVTNSGPSSALNALLTDPIPANTTFVSATPASGWTETDGVPVGGTGTLSFTKPSLASAETGSFTIVVHVNTGTADGTLLHNVSTVSSSTTDPDLSNNTSTATTTVNTQADLAISKTGPASAIAGNNFSYTVTVTNLGPSDGQNVAWTDTVPTGTSFVSQIQTAGPAFTLGNTGNAINNTISALTAGASATFTVTVHANANVANGTILNNTATAATTTTDPNPANNTSTATTTISTQADVAVTKTAPATVLPGGNLTYTLVVTNLGPSDAQSVALTDTVPTGTDFVSQSQSSGPVFTLSNIGNTINDTISALSAGASATISVVVQVDGGLADGTVLMNTATVSTTTTDPNLANNTSTATTTVQAQADLAITKTGPVTALAGEDFSYTVTVTNNGPGVAQTVAWTDTVPAGTSFVSQSQTSGPAFTLSHVGNAISNTISNLSVEASASFTVIVHVNASLPDGTILNNTATVAAVTTDPDPTNNTSTATTTVNARADLAVTKSSLPAFVAVDADLTYTISFNNAGPSDAQTVAVTDAVPAHTTFVSATVSSGTGWSSTTPSVGGTGNVVFSKGTVADAETATFTIVVHVNPGTPPSTIISNTAIAAGVTIDPNLANNTGTATSTVNPVADLQITKAGSPNPVLPGQALTYTIVVTNAGPSDVTGAPVADTFPASLTGVTWSATHYTGGATSTPSSGSGGLSAAANMPAGSTITYIVHATVATGITGSLANTATVMPPENVTDPNLANNTASANTLLGGLINNGDPGFSLLGNWTLGSPCSGFFGDDVVYAAPAPPQATATWTFTNLTPGNYQVSTTWYSPPEFAANRATNAPFTISGGAAPVTVLVNQQLNPGNFVPHFSYLGSEWMNLSSSYTVTGTTLTVTLGNTANGYCLGDAVLVQQLPAALPAPLPAPFFASASTVPGGRGEAASLTSGNPTGGIASLANSLIMDNLDPGYRTSGSWTKTTGTGYADSVEKSVAATCGNSFATWQFGGLSPWLEYQVYATWTTGADRASAATYRLFRDVTSPLSMLGRVPVNQQLAPNDLSQSGEVWELLGSVTPDRDTISVQLTNAGTGLVVADAILLVPVLPATDPQLAVWLDGKAITPGLTTVDFGATLVGSPQQKTFLVRNTGSALALR